MPTLAASWIGCCLASFSSEATLHAAELQFHNHLAHACRHHVEVQLLPSRTLSCAAVFPRDRTECESGCHQPESMPGRLCTGDHLASVVPAKLVSRFSKSLQSMISGKESIKIRSALFSRGSVILK